MKWQPIETAPKDGTNVLLAIPGNAQAVIGKWEDRFDGVFTWHWLSFYGGDPTHWKPLPHLPTHLTDFEYSGKTKKVEGPFQYDGLK